MRVVIAEKPSVAKGIAPFFGASKSGNGCVEGNGVAVTWCFGHLFEQAPPEAYDPAYKKWRAEDLPIAPGQWKLEAKSDAKKQLSVIGKLLKQAKEVIHAGDPDREGQLLVDEVLEHFGYKGPVKRLWLAALDDASIKKAIGGMRPGDEYKSLGAAAEARSRADWLVGMNLSRAYTIAGRASGHDGVLSVGRVQTPTLALIVRRDLEIEQFKPRDYFVPLATFRHANGAFKATWQAREGVPGLDEEGRLIDASIANALVAKVTGKPGVIAKYEQKAGKETAPLPFSLSELQKACSAKWGLGAQQVLDIAQALYETHKVTSYPRTDCGYLPESQHADAARLLGALQKKFSFAKGANASIRSAAFNDKKVTAHHGIVPTGVLPGSLSDAEAKVYELICKHYVAQFYPDHEYLSTSVEVICEGETFKATGRVPTKPGWKVIFNGTTEDEAGDASEELPQMRQGEVAQCVSATAEAKQTKPPARFSDGTLVAAMTNIHKFVTDTEIKKRLRETQGIGTEATRAGIIETLLKRGFVQKKGKHLISTPQGRALVAALGSSQVADPGMTGLFEQALEMVVDGKLDPNRFLASQVAWLKEQIGQALSSSIGGAAPAPAVKCPTCGKPMRKRAGAKGAFWGCTGYPDCKATAPDVKGMPVFIPRKTA